MHDIAAEEGLIALAYERKNHQWRWVGLIMCNYVPAVQVELPCIILGYAKGSVDHFDQSTVSGPS